MLERLLPLWLIALSALAYVWPRLVPGSFDPFVASKPGLDVLFGVTMFLVGSLLPVDEVRQVRERWRAVLAGTTVQYLSMPALAYAVAWAASLPRDLFVGVIIVGCVPGAMASNVLTLAARGNVSYSVSLTTLATLLSPLVVPLALWVILGQTTDVNPLTVALGLLLQVVGPVILGHLLARHVVRWQQAARRIGPFLANLTILWIIAVVVALNRDRLAGAVGVVAIALIVLNVLGYAAGFVTGRVLRLPEGMVRALTLEIGMQNAGLGTLLAQRHFAEMPTSAIPPAAYTFGCMLTGAVLARLWAMRKLPD